MLLVSYLNCTITMRSNQAMLYYILQLNYKQPFSC